MDGRNKNSAKTHSATTLEMNAIGGRELPQGSSLILACHGTVPTGRRKHWQRAAWITSAQVRRAGTETSGNMNGNLIHCYRKMPPARTAAGAGQISPAETAAGAGQSPAGTAAEAGQISLSGIVAGARTKSQKEREE